MGNSDCVTKSEASYNLQDIKKKIRFLGCGSYCSADPISTLTWNFLIFRQDNTPLGINFWFSVQASFNTSG